MKKIYQQIDCKLQKNREALISFAKSKGFDHYSEYIVKSMGKKKLKEIQKEIKKFGIDPPLTQSMTHTKRKVLQLSERKTMLKTALVCAAEGCFNKVPPENHRFCKNCFNLNKKRSTYFDETYGGNFV